MVYFKITKSSSISFTNFNFEKHNNEKVCVISIIGKSDNFCKSNLIRLNSNIFPSLNDLKGESFSIDGYFSPNENLIYLHLVSFRDSSEFLNFVSFVNDQDHMSSTKLLEVDNLKATVFLFSISHIILINFPGINFDINYIKAFKILEKLRQLYLPLVSEGLRGECSDLPEDWLASGRPCSPRVLFVFYSTENLKKESCLRSLQLSIEDMIYKLLRKDRIITNISNNSLFAIPTNQEFVYIHGTSSDFPLKNPFATHSKAYQYIMNSQNKGFLFFIIFKIIFLFSTQLIKNEKVKINKEVNLFDLPSLTTLEEEGSRGSFHRFLLDHTEVALKFGFNDNTGKNPVPPVFHLVTIFFFKKVLKTLFSVFFGKPLKFHSEVEDKIQDLFSSKVAVDERFSESQCNKYFSVAESIYLEKLPAYYLKATHEDKLKQAIDYYINNSRGPKSEFYLNKLKEICLNYWVDGREACEEISVTGNPCLHKLHKIPKSFEEETEGSKRHSSNILSKATCNCGHVQAERPDPFTYKEANFSFYKKLEEECCGKLQPHPFFLSPFPSCQNPPLHPSIRRNQTSLFDFSIDNFNSLKPFEKNQNDQFPLITFGSGNGRSNSDCNNYNLSQSDEETVDDLKENLHSKSKPPFQQRDIKEEKLPNDDNFNNSIKNLTENCSKEAEKELIGMMNSTSAPNYSPPFFSWSLLRLKEYNEYDSIKGLNQPNFTHQANHLLPLDSSGPLEDKVYVGLEYECYKGHRFFVSSCDKIFRTHSSTFKENAFKILNTDMPLYSPCSCRNKTTLLAQLMRLHVLVPDHCDKRVKLKVKVQPHPQPCPIFFPETRENIILTSGWWLLRFPYVYHDGVRSYTMPHDKDLIKQCKLFKNWLILENKNV